MDLNELILKIAFLEDKRSDYESKINKSYELGATRYAMTTTKFAPKLEQVKKQLRIYKRILGIFEKAASKANDTTNQPNGVSKKKQNRGRYKVPLSSAIVLTPTVNKGKKALPIVPAAQRQDVKNIKLAQSQDNVQLLKVS